MILLRKKRGVSRVLDLLGAGRRRTIAFGLCGVISLTAHSKASSAPVTEDNRDRMIQDLLQRVDRLEAELSALKGSREAPTTSVPSTPVAPTREDEAEARALREDTGSGRPFPDLSIRGFGDMHNRLTDQPSQHDAFSFGQVDFFLTSRLSESLSVLGEMAFESTERNESSFEIERFHIKYSFSDYFEIALGRYHTSIGYYNTAYHHGTWFQTATGRPYLFKFEDNGGFLPIHNVGLTADGLIPSGGLGLRYVVEVGNGRNYSPNQEPVQTASDNNKTKAVNLALIARPEALPALELGISAYRDRLTTVGLPRIDQYIFSAHVVYKTQGFEWLNEGVWLRNRPVDTRTTFTTSAYYSQIARQFGKYRPYFRYQYIDFAAGDPLFLLRHEQGLWRGPSFGLRYDFAKYAALKIQYDRIYEFSGDPVNDLTFQVDFTF